MHFSRPLKLKKVLTDTNLFNILNTEYKRTKRDAMEKLSNSESVFMKVIWEADHDLPVTELMSILEREYGKDYKRTSVQTFLMKLELKGFITTRKEGKNAIVVPGITKTEYLAYVSEKDLEFWYQDDLARYISTLCSARKLRPEEAEHIRRMLDDSADL